MRTRGLVRTSGLVMVLVASAGVILFSVVWNGNLASARPGGEPGQSPDQNPGHASSGAPNTTRLVLAGTGLDRKALQAAGIADNTIASIESAASTWLSNPEHTLAQKQSAYRDAQRSTAATLRSPASTSEQKTAAKASLAAAKSALASDREALFTAVTANLDSAQVAKLRHIQSLRWTGHPPSTLVNAQDSHAVFAAQNSASNSQIPQ